MAIQLATYEYCTATLATSPRSTYSSAAWLSGSTQPVPVGVTMTRFSRSKAPMRIASSSASAARADGVSAELSPT